MRARPYPEALGRTGLELWRIDAGTGSTSIVDRAMAVPIPNRCQKCEVDHGNAVRFHELAHVKWSPDHLGKIRGVKGLPPIAVLLAEDMRIHEALEHTGRAYRIALGCTIEADIVGGLIELLLGDEPWPLLAKTLGGYLWPIDWPQIEVVFDSDPRGLIQAELVAIIESELLRRVQPVPPGIATWLATVLTLIRRAVRDIEMLGQHLPSRRRRRRPYRENGAYKTAYTRDVAKRLVKLAHDLVAISGLTNIDADGQYDRSREGNGRTVGDIAGDGWGSMTIKEPRLFPKRRGSKAARRLAVLDSGSEIVAIDNIVTGDGRYFGERVRRDGGTIVFDCSGSMQFDLADIIALVEAAPSATIATYAGDHNGSTGELRIVARRGRICAPDAMRPPGYLNIIDGPVLAWLGDQAKPRIWVSDGRVTGMGENRSASLRAQRDVLMAKHRIRRVDKPEGATDLLRRLKGRERMT